MMSKETSFDLVQLNGNCWTKHFYFRKAGIIWSDGHYNGFCITWPSVLASVCHSVNSHLTSEFIRSSYLCAKIILKHSTLNCMKFQACDLKVLLYLVQRTKLFKSSLMQYSFRAFQGKHCWPYVTEFYAPDHLKWPAAHEGQHLIALQQDKFWYDQKTFPWHKSPAKNNIMLQIASVLAIYYDITGK